MAGGFEADERERLRPQAWQHQQIGASKQAVEIVAADPSRKVNGQPRLPPCDIGPERLPRTSLRTIAGEREPQRPIQPLHDLRQRRQQFPAAFQRVHPTDEDQMPWRLRVARGAYTQAIGRARL